MKFSKYRHNAQQLFLYSKPVLGVIFTIVFFLRFKVQSYNKSVSTGNFINHLREKHDITEADCNKNKNYTKLTHWFGVKHRTFTSHSKQKDKQFILNRDIAAWFARDLIPFGEVGNSGFKDFMKVSIPIFILLAMYHHY